MICLVLGIGLFLLFVDQGDARKLYIIQPVCEEYQSAAAVFVATVTDVKRPDRNHIPTVMISGFPYSGTVVSMRIEEAFKGVQETDIVFTQRGDFETCTPLFTTGERWLIYAIRDPDSNAPHPKQCSRSAKVEFAGNDLRYLRALPEIADKTRLAGTIGQSVQESATSSRYSHLAGVKITVTDEQGQRYEGYSDLDGIYEFVGLPAGKYKVHADVPKNLKFLGNGKNDVIVTLAERGCVEANVWAISEDTNSGK